MSRAALLGYHPFVDKASTISLALAAAGIFIANSVSNTMKRLVYNRSGRSFRLLSTQLVREYRALYGQDRTLLGLCLRLARLCPRGSRFRVLPKVESYSIAERCTLTRGKLWERIGEFSFGVHRLSPAV